MKKVFVAVLLSLVFIFSIGVTLVIAQQDQPPVPIDPSSNLQQPITATTSSSIEPTTDSIELQLRSGAFDPLKGQPQAPDSLSRLLLPTQSGLRLVQFSGPIQDEWYTAISKAGLEIITYIPDYAYLVWGDDAAIKELQAVVPVRWSGVYQPLYALDPQLAQTAQSTAEVEAIVQLYDQPAADETIKTILAQATELRAPYTVLDYRNLGVRIASDQLNWLTSLPDVVNVESYPHYQKMDEIQGQILAGNLNAGGTQPAAPGYIAWLSDTIGLPTDPNVYPIVDVTDDGIDNGTAIPIHADFWTSGITLSPSVDRLIYNYNWSTDATANGVDGHGNINASIVAGYNDKTGFPYEDVSGATANYNFGLGINPFGRVAGSKVFNNGGAWGATASNSAIVSNSYALGARISSNSWGCGGTNCPGAPYTTDSQEYDALVRDAQPGSGAYAGNQPMIVVFAAGNNGSGASTIGSPATAKNVLTVGASENYRPTATDGCNVATTGADNAQDIIDFSSRGPTSDNRTKPDIMAPGTHIMGAASQATGYDGSGVCGGTVAPIQYYPTGQTLYTWSSGTSHSTPAIAGAASLIYRFYQDHFGGQPPSPAMLKAYLVNAARYLTGVSGSGNLPTYAQGFGEAYLGQAFDNVPRYVIDQSYVFSNTGQVYQVQGAVSDTSQPFRVTLAWTDAPGATTGNAYVNNLDLAVTIGGNTYRGNVFNGSTSTTGGAADARNNVESVFLPIGTSGNYTVVITATNIAGDGVPDNGDPTDQDFALVIYNSQGGTPTGVLTGIVTNSLTTAPVANAQITAQSSFITAIGTTNAAGQYIFPNILSGTYTVTASAVGYPPGTASGVIISKEATTTQNFVLSALPALGCYVDTTQADFETGVPTNCDLTGSPGNVTLLNPASIDQQNTSVTTSGFGFTSSSWAGQTFQAGMSGQLARVDLDLFCSGCTGTTPNLTVSIRATSGDLPTGADLAVATIPGFSSGAGGYYSANFATPATLTAGTRYAVVFRPVSNPSAGTYAYVVSTGSPYANGRRVTSANSGSTWTGQTTDIGFKTYMTTGYPSSGNFVSSAKDANPTGAFTPRWTTLAWNATTPASTSIKFQVAASNSSIGPFTFVGPDGTASTYFTTTGASLSQFDGLRYLKYTAYLTTTNSASTPTLADVTICFSNTIKVTPTISIVSSQNPSLIGQAVTFTANVSSGAGTPTGQIQFKDNGANLGAVQNLSSGSAAIVTSTLTVGSHTITANYLGDAFFNANSGTLAPDQVVTSTATWNGNTTTNWFVAANWIPAVPTTAANVVIPTAPPGNRWPILTGTATVNDLTLQSGAVLTVSQGITLYVNGLVANNGSLAQIKDVPASATTEFLHITDASGISDKYHGVDLTPGTTAMGVTTVQIKGNQSACTTVPGDPIIHRCYRIDPTTQTSATVRFWFTDAELNSQPANTLKLWHWGPWAQVGGAGNYTYSEGGAACTSGSGTACWFQSTGVASYSPFVLGSGSAPTALHLTQFDGWSSTALPLLVLSGAIALGLSMGLIILKRRRA